MGRLGFLTVTTVEMWRVIWHVVFELPVCLVSSIPLPFFCSVATVAVARENGIAGNVFPYT